MNADRGGGPDVAVTCVVFAHQEEHTIASSLASLGAQSVWRDRSNGRVIVACNGCTDRTVEVARAHAASAGTDDGPAYEVLDLAAPGKSRTWNTVRNRLADEGTEGVIVFMDSDIRIDSRTAVAELVELLAQDPEVWIASSRPHRTLPEGSGRVAKLLLRASDDVGGDHRVWGGLYAMRATTVAATVMPDGLPLDDGYLAAMAITEHLAAAPNFDRVRQIESEFRIETDPDLRRALRRKTRMLLGVTVNHALFSWLRGDTNRFDETESTTDLDVTSTIEDLNAEDPDWLRRVLLEFSASHRLPIPRYLLWGDGRPRSLGELVRRAASGAYTSVAYVWATIVFRRNGGIGCW